MTVKQFVRSFNDTYTDARGTSTKYDFKVNGTIRDRRACSHDSREVESFIVGSFTDGSAMVEIVAR